jgi:hypothetical protein
MFGTKATEALSQTDLFLPATRPHESTEVKILTSNAQSVAVDRN